MRIFRSPRLLIVAILAVLAAGALTILLTGLVHYGGLVNLELRVRSAVAAHRPLPAALLPAVTPMRDPGAPRWDPALIPPSATPRPPTPAATPLPLPLSLPLGTAMVEAPAVEPVAATTAPLVVQALPAATAAPADAPAPLPTAVALTGLRHAWQTWNNCGPATLATNLSYYGGTLDQAAIGAVLRRSPDDKNVSPEELAAFAQAQGMQAIVRVNGSASLLRALVAAGYPVLIETWLEEQPNDGMGHYRLITGYDDAAQAWIAYDSYVSSGLVQGGAKDGSVAGDYRGIYFPYAQAAAWWKVFNYTYVLVYPPAAAANVQAILGAAFEGGGQWAAAEATARAELAANPGDAFAWFNLGSSLWAQNRAAQAADAFDQARALGLPWRMLWYQFAPFAAYSAVGRHQDVVTLADATLANTDSVEEIYYWKARALAAQGDSAGARAALDRALALYPGYGDAATLRAAIGP